MDWSYDYDTDWEGRLTDKDIWEMEEEDRIEARKKLNKFRVTMYGKQFIVYAKSETKAYKEVCKYLGVTLIKEVNE